MARTPKESQQNHEATYAELLKMLQDERQKASDSKTMNEALVASIGDGVIIINEYGNITQINKAALNMLGYSHKELHGAWLPNALPSLDKEDNEIPIPERSIVRALLTGTPVSEVAKYIKKDGSSLPVAVTASPFLIKDKPRGAIIVFRDISHEISVEKAKDEFVSLASHQLRTPLTSIRMLTEILKDKNFSKLTKKQRDYVNKIQLSAERMLDLVSDFLNISRLELGRLNVNPAPTDIVRIIEDQLVELKPQLDSNRIRIVFNKSGATTKKAMIDPHLISQVIHNLISNAVRYSKPGMGKIKIETKETAKEIKLAITDNGIGIPALAQPQIFQRLFRADNAIESHKEGTGLGLYLVKKIIEASDGNITFKSQENKGTSFTISLPASKNH